MQPVEHILHLRNPNPGSADGFHQQPQPLLALPRRSIKELLILCPRQLPALLPESFALNPEEFDFTILPSQKPEQRVDGGQHGVDGCRSIPLPEKMVPPPGGGFPGQLAASQPGGKRGSVVEIFFNGAGTAVLIFQAGCKGTQFTF